MNLRGAIFDFDGTLFDTMAVWDTAGEDYLRTLGIQPRDSLRDILKPMSLEQAARWVREQYALPLSVSEIMDGVTQLVADFYRYAALPKPGVDRFLAQLRERSVSMCIATATEEPLIRAALERCGLDGYFSQIFTCTGVGVGKDHPDIYRLALAHLGTPQEDTLVFEDALHAARTAAGDGFAVAAVYDGHEPQQEELRTLARLTLPDYLHLDLFWSTLPIL